MIDLQTELIPAIEQEDDKTKEQPPVQVVVNFPPIKGDVIQALGGHNPEQVNITSEPIWMGGFNHAHIEVTVIGNTPSATITVKGNMHRSGNYKQLPDTNAQQTNVNADKAFDVVVGSNWIVIDLTSISGTFGAGTGYRVEVLGYNA